MLGLEAGRVNQELKPSHQDVYSDEAGLKRSWEVSLQVKVWINGIVGPDVPLGTDVAALEMCASAHVSGRHCGPRAELKWSPCSHGHGCG